MLAAGTYDIAALYGAEAEVLAMTDPRFIAKITQAQTNYSDWSFYLLMSRMTFDTDNKRITAIWRAIRTVRESDEYRKLESAWRQTHQTFNPTSASNDN